MQQTKTFERRLQIPAVYIGKDLYKLVRKFLFSRRVPEEALEGYFWFLFSTLVSIEVLCLCWNVFYQNYRPTTLFCRNSDPQAKTSSALAELSGIGIRILLQILLRDAKFDLFERSRKKIEEEVTSLSNLILDPYFPLRFLPQHDAHHLTLQLKIYRKNKLPTAALTVVVWLGGQLLFSHPTRALAVWLAYCLPPLANAGPWLLCPFSSAIFLLCFFLSELLLPFSFISFTEYIGLAAAPAGTAAL